MSDWKLGAQILGIAAGVFVVAGVVVLVAEHLTREDCAGHPIETVASQDDCTTYYVCGTHGQVYYTRCAGVASTSHTDCHDETRIVGRTTQVEKVCQTRTMIQAP